MRTPEIEKVTVVGSGNVATHLAKAFFESGLTISGIYSRTLSNAETLAKKVDSRALTTIDELDGNYDLLVLAVPDIAIADVARSLPPQQPLTVHVSGSTAMDALEPHCEHYGVLYPLQTFTKDEPLEYGEIPFCIEASSDLNVALLQQIARKVTTDVRIVDSRQRLVIHLSAVYASNFTNFMNVIANDILHRQGISRDILFPLIRETTQKILKNDPITVQTGPAVRGDHGTLQKHVEALSMDIENQKIYRILSEEIQKYFKDL